MEYAQHGNGCCCLTFRDEFDRATINDTGRNRYQQADYLLSMGLYHDFVSPWSTSISDWSISSGQAVCSTSGKWLRLFHPSDTFSNVPGLYVFPAEIEYTLTYTGAGKILLGEFVSLNYADNIISFGFGASPQAETDWATVPFTFSSGTTYHIKMRVMENTVGTNPWQSHFELWIDGVKIKKTNLSIIACTSWVLLGSGTLEIGNIKLRRLYNPALGLFAQRTDLWCTENCFKPARCVFPWPDDPTGSTLPAQIQLDIAGVGSDCADCVSAPFNCPCNPFGNGTFVLDLMANSVCHSLMGGPTPCACYQLSASFGCYQLLTVRVVGDTITLRYSEPTTPDTQYMEFVFFLTAKEDALGEHRYKGDTLSMSATTLGTTGNCRFTQLDMISL